MDSGSLPAASSPKAMDDTEVLSQRIPDQGETQETVRAVPEDETSAAGHMGEQIPMETGDGGHIQLVPQPNMVPETYAAPEPGKQPPTKGGGAPIPPVTSVQPEVPDTLMEVL